MKKLTMLVMILSICSSAQVFAEDDREDKKEEQSIDQMLGSLKIEKLQAELMIETMANRGKLNNDEAAKAKREIASVKEEDEKNFKAEARERLSSKKSYATNK